MFKGFLIGLVVAVIVAAGGAYLVLAEGIVPAAAAHAGPLPLERWAARTALRATLAREAPRGPGPVALSDASLLAGIRLYQQHCMLCHGDARGTPAASAVARGEYPHPPQLASDGVEDDPIGYTYWKIHNGIRWTAMPAWAGTLTPSQMWTLALFLKHMNRLPPAPAQAWQAAATPPG